MKYAQNTESYNSNRYGKPWIARVTFDQASKAVFNFGSWVGQDGYAGILEIDADPGDVIAIGQKDNRKPRNSAPEYYILSEDGTLSHVSKVDAYKHYRDNVDVMPSRDELLAKKEELIKKLEFIETLLSKATK